MSASKTRLHRGPRGWAVCHAERRKCPYGTDEHIEVSGPSTAALGFLNEAFSVRGIETAGGTQRVAQKRLDLLPEQVRDVIYDTIGVADAATTQGLVAEVGEYAHRYDLTYDERYQMIFGLMRSALYSQQPDAPATRQAADAARLIFLRGGVATASYPGERMGFYNLRTTPRYHTAESYEIERGDVVRFERDGEVFHAEVVHNQDMPGPAREGSFFVQDNRVFQREEEIDELDLPEAVSFVQDGRVFQRFAATDENTTLATLQRAFTDEGWAHSPAGVYDQALHGPQQVLVADEVTGPLR